MLPAGSVTIWVQGPDEDEPLSTLNPVSLVELSIQARLICASEAGLAVRLPGERGIVADVVALAVFEVAETPLEVKAYTRYQYAVDGLRPVFAYEVALAAVVATRPQGPPEARAR